MLKRVLPACLVAAALLAANGCCCSRPMMCHGNAVAESCGSGDCGECASCGGARCQSGHPWHGTRNMLTCGAGCGEMYWGDWISHPPACGDPCDNCGNWIGDGCCGPWPLFSGLRSLWGYRYRSCGCGASDCDGDCSSCGGGCSDCMSGHAMQGHPGEAFAPPSAEPEPAPPRKTRETSYRIKHATYTKPAAKNASKPVKYQTAPTASQSQPVPQTDERVSRDITR
jgi:hypothetical protein